MNDHLSTSQVKALAIGRLAPDEGGEVAQHIATCEQCHLRFTTELIDRPSTCSFSLESEFWFKHDHLSLAHLTSLADDAVEHESQEVLDAHLDSCELCRESVASLQHLREGVQERDRSGDSSIVSPDFKSVLFNKAVVWRGAYWVAAVILITAAALTSVMVISKMPKSSVTKTSGVVTIPSSNSSGSPVETQGFSGSSVKEDGLVAVLADGPQRIAIYKDGHIEGVQGVVSLTTSQDISRAILKGYFRAPNVLKELTPGSGSLRGSNDREDNFQLIYPKWQVIIETRPRFRWQSLAGVTSYQVYVVNSDGQQVARSQILPPSQLRWAPQNSLQRGKVYNWTVIAMVNGQEVISPPPAEPEIKFAILSENDKNELDELNKLPSHLVRGVFFARTGLFAEAEAEFEKLVQLNPQSPIPRKLLKSAQAIRTSKSN